MSRLDYNFVISLDVSSRDMMCELSKGSSRFKQWMMDEGPDLCADGNKSDFESRILQAANVPMQQRAMALETKRIGPILGILIRAERPSPDLQGLTPEMKAPHDRCVQSNGFRDEYSSSRHLLLMLWQSLHWNDFPPGAVAISS